MTASVDVSVKGENANRRAVEIDGILIVRTGRFPRIAAVHDESFVDTVVSKPEPLIEGVSRSSLGADVLTFVQGIDDAVAKYPYFYDLDNVAAAETGSFTKWWDKLPQSTRKNCRRAERRGVVTRVVQLDENLARGIKGIYDETPIRQGRRFWHYGKNVDRVFQENSSYLDRSDFIASYSGDELVGFLKMVYIGRVARIMQILSRVSHYDKRPMNALIAKAVEVCGQKGMTHLVYGKYQYGNRTNTPIMEFKMRNGFDQLLFPRYFVPLTFQGRIAIACRLHRGILGLLPPVVINNAVRVRDSINGMLNSQRVSGTTVASPAGEAASDE